MNQELINDIQDEYQEIRERYNVLPNTILVNDVEYVNLEHALYGLRPDIPDFSVKVTHVLDMEVHRAPWLDRFVMFANPYK